MQTFIAICAQQVALIAVENAAHELSHLGTSMSPSQACLEPSELTQLKQNQKAQAPWAQFYESTEGDSGVGLTFKPHATTDFRIDQIWLMLV